MTPDPNNFSLGAGEVHFDRFDSNGRPTNELRHLGNVSKFSWATTVEKIQKKSAMSGNRAVLAEVITGATIELTMTLDEYDTHNLALALLGTESAFTQAAQAAITAKPITDSLNLDSWYDLGGLTPTVTDFKQGATTLDPASYTVDPETGMVIFHSAFTGANKPTAGTALTWDGSFPAIISSANIRVVQALTSSKLSGHIRYRSAPDQAQGPRYLIDMWNTNIVPDGELPLLGLDFGAFNLKGVLQQDATRAVGDQFMRLVTLN